MTAFAKASGKSKRYKHFPTVVSALFFLILTSCFEAEVDRISDPVARAAFNCRYVLERTIATDAELSPDGVLRRRIADFAAPVVTRSGHHVQFLWADRSIVHRRTGRRHRGQCTMDLSDGGQRLERAELDGRALRANYRF